MEILIVMCAGVALGATVFPAALKGTNEKLTLVATGLLIFSMGAMLGSRDAFVDEIVSLGLSSLAFAILPIAFSVVCVYILTRLFLKDITERHKHDAAQAEGAEGEGAGSETVMIIMAVGSLAAGVAYGLSHIGIFPIDWLVEHSDWILTALMFFVGISVGGSKGLLAKIREYHVRALIIPIGILIGSIAGGLAAAPLCGIPLPVGGAIASGLGWYSLSGVMLTGIAGIGILIGSIAGGLAAAPLCGIPLPVGGAIASGLGWYSLSGVMLTGIAGAHIGSITFMANLLRELISFFTIPWIAKHLNYPTCIAPAGATSEDTTLPMMIRCTNSDASSSRFSPSPGLRNTSTIPPALHPQEPRARTPRCP